MDIKRYANRAFAWFLIAFLALWLSAPAHAHGWNDNPKISHDGRRACSEVKVVTVEGMVCRGKDDKVCILQNWESKSRISYYISGPYVRELAEHMGEIVRVEGSIIKEESQWNKLLEVDSILSIRPLEN